MGTVDRSEWQRWAYQTWNDDSTSKTFKNVKLVKTRTGTSNPNWKTQIANHTQAGTNLSGVNERILLATKLVTEMHVDNSNRPSGRTVYKVNGDVAGHRYTSATISSPSVTLTSARYSAMSKALKQIHKVQSLFSGGVFLGEMREALHMLRNPAEGLMKAVRSDYLDAVKRKKALLSRGKTRPVGKDMDRWKRAISQSWLEGCFGWLPFINDLEDAGKAYQRLTDEEVRYEKIRAVGKESQLVGSSTEQFAPVADFFHLGTSRTVDEAVVVIRGEVKSKVGITALEKARLFGLSPGEFIPTIWELLPWSFLVDYFTNVGDILENSVTDTSQVTWLMESSVKKRTIYASVRPDLVKNKAMHGGDKYYECSGSQSNLVLERREVGRAMNPALTVPPLTFEIPGSPLKWANMLALWTQANSIWPQDVKFRGGRRIS